MNCLKCPIANECKVSKFTTNSDYCGAVNIPREVMPYNLEECPLVKIIRHLQEKEQ